MLDLLLLPISFLAGLAVYRYSERRAAQKAVTSPPVPDSRTPDRSPNSSFQSCIQIMNITPTNNSYDPMGDVLSELDLDGVQVILGKVLRADMEGYMQ